MNKYVENQAALNSILSGLADDKNKLTSAYMAMGELLISDAIEKGTITPKSSSVKKLDEITHLSDRVADLLVVDRVLLRTVFSAILTMKLPNVDRVMNSANIGSFIDYGLSYDPDLDIRDILSKSKLVLGIRDEL